MTVRNILLSGALAVALALLSPIRVTGQGGNGPVDVFVQVGGIEYQCYPVVHNTDEAPHETPTTTPPATLTPPPTVTQEITALPTLADTAIPKPTQTPTPAPTLDATPTESGCTGYVTSVSGLNARAAPSLSAQVLGVFHYRQGIDLYAIGDNGWFRTVYGNREAWVHPAHVEPEITAGCLTLGHE